MPDMHTPNWNENDCEEAPVGKYRAGKYRAGTENKFEEGPMDSFELSPEEMLDQIRRMIEHSQATAAVLEDRMKIRDKKIAELQEANRSDQQQKEHIMTIGRGIDKVARGMQTDPNPRTNPNDFTEGARTGKATGIDSAWDRPYSEGEDFQG